jgi:DNA-binding NtrC family response regulator
LEQALLDHAWPGNVRELENLMRRFLVFPDAVQLADELREAAGGPGPSSAASAAPPLPGRAGHPRTVPTLSQVADDRTRAEIEAIRAALDRVRWNRRRAAALLNVEYKSLLYRMKKLGIDEPHSEAALAGE